MPLVVDCLTSLRQLKTKLRFDIGILDIGLSDDSKDIITSFGVTIKKANVDIEYPAREAWERQAFFFRALTARPFLPSYFPGYQSYMWMDADAWAQTPDALETMLPAAAADEAIYIAMEADRDYYAFLEGQKLWGLYNKWYGNHFPDYLAKDMMMRPMLNCGVWAGSPRAVFWSKWADLLKRTLQTIPEMTGENFMSDQLCLNILCYLGGVPFKVMPASFNWLALFSIPAYDEERQAYVTPTIPHTPLSIIHLNHNGKLKDVDIRTTKGNMIKRPLTYAACHAQACVNEAAA